MNRVRINSTAALGMSLVAAVSSILIAPIIENTDLIYQVAYALVATIGFFVFFSIIQRILTWLSFRKILGKWHYVTTPFSFSSYQDANYAVMTFFIAKDGNLNYKVDLYPTRKGVEIPGSEPSRGYAISKACRYDESTKKIDLVFSVFYKDETNQGSRDGRLYLRFVEAGHLEGDWASEVSVHKDDDSVQQRRMSTGRMIAARPKRFSKIADAELHRTIGKKAPQPETTT